MHAYELAEHSRVCAIRCVEHGWHSVVHLRSGGPKAADAFVAAMKLKTRGTRAKRLKKELQRDEFAWDAHAAAARNGVAYAPP
jgi:hypothetical protein